ncbi:MAG: threonine synthase [Spirochaetia bacterium]|nr:threonine synthase [Spirochaetia bacterium]
MTFRSDLACIDCATIYPMDEIIYRCRRCDGLLEVKHDMQAVTSVSAAEWKARFSGRLSGPAPFSSGIWARKEWVLPGVDQKRIVSLGEGNSALIDMPRYASHLGLAGFAVKQCGVSHTGSFKDLGMTVLVSHVNHLMGRGAPVRAVACASTGDTSAALAAYAAYAGIPTVVFLPAGKISTAQLVQPLAAGAIVLSLDTDFDGCMAIVKEVTKDQGLYLANSMNPLRIEGQKTVSFEIVHQMQGEVPDWVVIPGGNLGNVSALGAGFKMMKEAGLISKYPRIAVAQSARANPLYISFKDDFRTFAPVRAETTLASAIQIGNPVSYPRAVRTLKEFEGVVEQASEAELADAAAESDRYGLFNDPHTGVAIACTRKLAGAGIIARTDRVVVVSTAHGLKFSEFKTGYHEDRLPGMTAVHKNMPVRLPPDLDQVRTVLDRRLGGHVV